MVDKKVEINFLTESDAYWTWKDELEIDVYNDIKSKFSDERIIDTKSATFNKKGEILVPVNLSKIGKPKNFIRLNAIVKIIEEKKEGAAQKKEQGFYMTHKDLTLLYPPATLPTIAENKGAVMVGREKISGGQNKSEDKCPRCEDEITLKIIEDAFQVYSNQKDFREKIVSSLNKFIKQRKDQGKDLHVNTCLRKAHFFAQVEVETLGIHGDWTVEGKMNHSVTSAKSAFGDRAKTLESKGLLSSYCNDRPQERLLNYMYARGNGYDNGNGIESSGDGWKFRGRGLKQINGRGNYNMISGVLKDIFPAEYNKLPPANRGEERLESHPEKVEEIDYAVITAIAYWEKHEIWKLADKITSKSNSDDDFYVCP